MHVTVAVGTIQRKSRFAVAEGLKNFTVAERGMLVCSRNIYIRIYKIIIIITIIIYIYLIGIWLII